MGTRLARCTVLIPTMDQTPSNPFYLYITSRRYQCDIPRTVLAQGRTYDFRVSSAGSAKASVIVAGDAAVWPYSPAAPYADAMGTQIPGSYVSSAGLTPFYDLMYGMRITG